MWRRGGRSDRFVAGFCALVGLMQAVELAMWSDQACGTVNETATASVPVVLIAQAVWLVGGGYLYRVTRIPPRVLLVWVASTAVAMAADAGAHHVRACSKAHPSSGHMVWGGVSYQGRHAFNVPYFAATAILLTLRDRAYGRALFAAVHGSLLLVLAKRHIGSYWVTGTWKSVWCAVSSALLPAVALAWPAASRPNPA